MEIYKKFVEKIIDNIFNNEHSIYVTGINLINNNDPNKKLIQIIIAPGKEFVSKVIGKNGSNYYMISNLVKIKGYLNNCQIILDIVK